MMVSTQTAKWLFVNTGTGASHVAIDVTRTTGLVITDHLQRFGEETDLVFLFGSREEGTAHPDSDVDLCYVPVQESLGHTPQ